uniref:RING finger protein 10 n=1 Tax=Cajanus cajan TaxID=3821 RepID=A0A151T926_CAJCA|nr:RING finger protein 10 [Cajanus cajan]
MSILPSQTQAPSSSSSSAPSPNPNPQHGIPNPIPQPFPSLSPPLHVAFGSFQISDNPGSSAPAAQDSGGSSEKVMELGSPSEVMVSPQQNSRTRSRSHGGRRAGTGMVSSNHRNQQTHGSVNPNGSAPSAGRKAQTMNGNYLLNFHYDPISRSQPRGPPPPPLRKRKPYNKDLFLQANFKFMVLDSGNYSPESMDPDKMLQWEDIICDIWKRCPLCFVMISAKDLYTVHITNVKHGDICDPFSKFTLTSDVDLSVRHAISDLDGWLARADSGLVDDLEKLPYVCAAMQQLEQRKRYWNEQTSRDCEKSSKLIDYGQQIPSADQNLDVEKELIEQEMNLSSSYEEKNSIQRHSDVVGDVKENDSYSFYQAADGQHLILHPLNMKCLLHHYGSYDMLPHRISGRILQLETVTQSEAMRRRYRFLSHFPLTTTFQLCEVDLSDMLPPEALAPFMDEIKKRATQRKQLAKKEQKDKIKAEATAAYSLPISLSSQFTSRDDPPTFSMADFEALGNSTISSSPPLSGERNSFSNVTRLGFAAGHDSPSLQIPETSGLHNNNTTTDSSVITGLRSGETQSYSNVISRAESNASAKTNELGKKGRKSNRVLLSTAGGRRY